jgi:hypothetical protein
MPGPNEARDVADLAAGHVVLQPLAQPDHLLHAERFDQDLLDLLARHVGIAIGIEEGRFAGDHGPFAVNIHAATFQHQVVRIGAHLEMLQNLFCHLGVALVILVAEAPGVPSPSDASHALRLVHQERRAVIADPAIVVRQ